MDETSSLGALSMSLTILDTVLNLTKAKVVVDGAVIRCFLRCSSI